MSIKTKGIAKHYEIQVWNGANSRTKTEWGQNKSQPNIPFKFLGPSPVATVEELSVELPIELPLVPVFVYVQGCVCSRGWGKF